MQIQVAFSIKMWDSKNFRGHISESEIIDSEKNVYLNQMLYMSNLNVIGF